MYMYSFFYTNNICIIILLIILEIIHIDYIKFTDNAVQILSSSIDKMYAFKQFFVDFL